MNSLRPELTPLPYNMRGLPVFRGYPVPYFVETVGGTPDFRVMSKSHMQTAHRDQLCWICGRKRGVYLTFVLGPMCCVTRTSAELPCHTACAEWSVKNCPFLTRPHAVRRDNLPEGVTFSGDMIARNPGVMALWICKRYTVFHPEGGGVLFEVGDPVEPLRWWSEGREATEDEIRASLDSGIVLLRERNPEEADFIEQSLNRFLETHKLWSAPATGVVKQYAK